MLTSARFPLRQMERHPHVFAHLVVLSVAATTVLQSMATGALTVALPSMAADLGLATDELQWPLAVMSLTNGALLLIAGAMADSVAGRRNTFLAGLLAFTTATAATALVRTGVQLSALCACIGCAAAMLSPAGVGILASSLPDDGPVKSRAFAALGAGQPIGFIVGLLLGGILSTGGHWRFIFAIAAGIGLLFLVLCLAVLPRDGTAALVLDSIHADSNEPSRAAPSVVTLRQALAHFDWVGALLSTAGLVLLTFALADAETAPQGWRTPYIPAMLPLACLCLSSFLLWERRLERIVLATRQRGHVGPSYEPLLPPSIWRAPRFGILLAIVFLSWLSFNALSYLITLYIQLVQHVSPLHTSLRFLPMVGSGIIISSSSGALMPHMKPVWIIVIGSAGGCAAAVLYALLSPTAPYFPGQFFVMVLVVATDFAFPVAQLFSVRSAGKAHAALAGSLFSTTVRVASSTGLALTSAISTAVARGWASAHPSISISSGGTHHHAVDAPQALMHGYRAAAWTCAASSLLAVGLALATLRDVGPLRTNEEPFGYTEEKRVAAAAAEEASKDGGNVPEEEAGNGVGSALRLRGASTNPNTDANADRNGSNLDLERGPFNMEEAPRPRPSLNKQDTPADDDIVELRKIHRLSTSLSRSKSGPVSGPVAASAGGMAVGLPTDGGHKDDADKDDDDDDDDDDKAFSSEEEDADDTAEEKEGNKVEGRV